MWDRGQFLKKSGSVLRERTQAKYTIIKNCTGKFPICLMCRLLSKSGYHESISRPLSDRTMQNEHLTYEIKSLFEAEKKRSGAIRLTKKLKAQGLSVGRHRVARIMRLNTWRARAAKKFKVTTNSKHSLPVSPNRLAQNFESSRANEQWVSDMPDIWTEEGWLYLAVVMDLYSRKIVGWALSKRMHRKLVIDALKIVIGQRKMPRGVIVYSDRGSQYSAYETLFKSHR